MPQSQTKIASLALASAFSSSVAIACAFDIEAALAQPLQSPQQNTARLFKRDYSVHPILASRAFADLTKTPSLADCRALVDIKPDANYFEHFKAESAAAQTLCDLSMSGQFCQFPLSKECDNQERHQDLLFGYNQIPVRTYYLNGKVTRAEIRWRGIVNNKLATLNAKDVEQTCIEEGKQAIHKRDSLLGKSQDEIIGSEGEPLIQLGFNDIWDSRKDITANWFYYAKPRFAMRLAFNGTTCVDACILNDEQVHDLFIWRMCQINGSKKTNRPPSLAHCIIPEDGPGGKTIAEIVALYGKPQKIETSGQQTKLFYPVHPGAWCELLITNGKCDEHVSLMATSGGVPYSQMYD